MLTNQRYSDRRSCGIDSLCAIIELSKLNFLKFRHCLTDEPLEIYIKETNKPDFDRRPAVRSYCPKSATYCLAGGKLAVTF